MKTSTILFTICLVFATIISPALAIQSHTTNASTYMLQSNSYANETRFDAANYFANLATQELLLQLIEDNVMKNETQVQTMPVEQPVTTSTPTPTPTVNYLLLPHDGIPEGTHNPIQPPANSS